MSGCCVKEWKGGTMAKKKTIANLDALIDQLKAATRDQLAGALPTPEQRVDYYEFLLNRSLEPGKAQFQRVLALYGFTIAMRDFMAGEDAPELPEEPA